MKIASVHAYPLTAPRSEPMWTAHEALSAWSLILVEVRTEDGFRGYGQIHTGATKEVCRWVEELGARLTGADPLAHVAVWDSLFAATSPRPGGMFGRDGAPPPLPRSQRPSVMAAIGGIDIALWDIKGKAAGLPVYTLLGGTGSPVPIYATGGFYRKDAAPESYADEFAAFIAAGFSAVKLKSGGEDLPTELARIRAIREAIGGARLMLDVNAAYSVEGAIEATRAFAAYDITWFEEPLHWYCGPLEFATLAQSSPIPLAHGERELHRFTVRDFVEIGRIRYVQFDATRAAGFTEALRVAHNAVQHGAIVAPHAAPEIHAHLASAFRQDCFGVEMLGSKAVDPLSHGLWQSGPKVEKGMFHLGDGPGFGCEPDWDFVRAHRAG